MGCFNITCFASNQTIAPGDACRVLPILQQSTYSAVALTQGEHQAQAYGASHSTCYADAFWAPAGGFVQAVYDDYGRVKLQLDPLMRAHVLGMLENLYQRGWTSAAGENPSHDLPFDLKGFLAEKAPGVARLFSGGDAFSRAASQPDAAWQGGALDDELNACWDYVWEVAREQRLFASSYQGVPRAHLFAVMHEQVYQTLVGRMAGARDWGGNTYEPRAHLAGRLAEGHSRIAERKKTLAEKDPTLLGDKADMMTGFWLSDVLRDTLSRASGQGGTVAGVASSLTMEWGLAFADGKMTEEALIESMVPLLQDQYALGALNDLNLRITPLVTAGQDYDNEIGRAYADFIAQASRRVTRARKERDGPLQPYALIADSQEQVDSLEQLIGEWDGYVDDVEVTQVEGKLHVNLSCTLALDDLREALDESDLPALAASLAVRALAEPADASENAAAPQ
jgi:hypothetical protein